MRKSPAFQFYPSDFLSDENVVLMTNQEIGCYMKLMCYCWREGSIPSDINKIAKLCGEDGSVMAQLWLSLCDCFSEPSNNNGRLIHPRLEAERNKQENHKQERSVAGKKGAESRWNKGLIDYSSAIAQPSDSHSSAIKEPMAKNGSSSSSSTSVKKVVTNVTKKKVDRDTDLPDWMPSDVWKMWIDHRKAIKKPLSENSSKLNLKQLLRFKENGFNPIEIIEASISNGWQGLFEPKTLFTQPRINNNPSKHDLRCNYMRSKAQMENELYGTQESNSDPRDITGESKVIADELG